MMMKNFFFFFFFVSLYYLVYPSAVFLITVSSIVTAVGLYGEMSEQSQDQGLLLSRNKDQLTS